MSELLTAAQMKAIEAAPIASGVVTGLELMERAGAGVVAAVLAEWPEMALAPQRAMVLCGPGNNGGDGFVVARLLKARGWAVEVYLYGDASKLPADARVNYERWCELGEVRSAETFAPLETEADLYVDALFGIGLSRPLNGAAGQISKELESSARNHRGQIVAVDVPSGLCSDSGRDLSIVNGGGLRADLTVTFQFHKLGHFLADGSEHCGKILCVDIGLDCGAAMKVLGEWYDPLTKTKPNGSVAVLFPQRWMECDYRGANSILTKWGGHKFSHGHALICSGDHGQAGAARLAARGALRIGAGLVTVASPPAAMAENAARLDAVMLKPVADAAKLAEVLADTRITAVCLGPGMGVVRAAELLPVAVRAKHTPCIVLDADALTAVALDPALLALLNDRCVLTPHAGEFARLFPDIAERLAAPATQGPAYSKVDATREASARAGCVVLYKGADTVIATPDGRCSINAAVYERSAPWLAAAGSGDVLAGFITGLLARGFQPMQAAETAAWLHVECARSFGPGLIAEDLPEELPKVFRALGV
ncbi:bifunctional NAD(P)H-hydrate repair enzyme [Cypionkella aquatica]|uniref:Bifunctional NAD(P)H-hydrate repair enzyme n=1 Tax=Cypionkella aquatica TaxID=1756042 RepID=A0AA37X2A1_9RHOB|nr:NAD(P)H-hydrate dehydratase [Cypionkella aquatica]GLS87365.1 bifunctional NAD(P)H-hydrate repair enzyme [Cypionkella aquatica]